MRPISNIVIHCSDSGWGDKSIINKWHKQRGFREIGYHYVLLNGKRTAPKYLRDDDGLIEPGRELNNDLMIDANEKGAHAYGYNSTSIGICMIGKDKFSPHQFESLVYICKYYKAMIPDIKILGHYETGSKKSCPNFNMDKFRLVINNSTMMPDIKHYFYDHI